MKRYGIRGDDIHTYLDEPCTVAGQNHRQFRHDTKTVKLVGELFGPKYGRELAENIALDHITADHEEEIRDHKDSVVLLKCPNCGGPLGEIKNGMSKCGYCGYEAMVTKFSTDTTTTSVRLPSKHKCVLMCRCNLDESLPKVLPPLSLTDGHQVIDDVYASFHDKRQLETMLNALGYLPVTVNKLRQRNFGCMTDSQIKELIQQSKTVTPQKIKELLERPDTQAKYARLKRYQDINLVGYRITVLFFSIFFAIIFIIMILAANGYHF